MKILHVVGARPNFMKVFPIMNQLRKYPRKFTQILVHTGQHYDKNMSKAFFNDLRIPRPDIYLGVGSGTHAEQTAQIMIEFETVCLREKPDLVLVVGDVNSTLACSVVAAKLCISVAHVEAGLRSFDRTMPEEINRIVTDSLSSILFTTCKDANDNLKKEGVSKNKIFFVGNVMIDTLLKLKVKAKKSKIVEILGLKKRDYAVLTLHRPSNVDDKTTLQNIFNALEKISDYIKIIFPVHPRTIKQMKTFGVRVNTDNIRLMEPLGYIAFLRLYMNSKFVLTDSGGIQEETTFLNIPCLTLRNNTERPITVHKGTNIIVGSDPDKILKEAQRIIGGTLKKADKIPLWDGKTSERITKVLLQI